MAALTHAIGGCWWLSKGQTGHTATLGGCDAEGQKGRHTCSQGRVTGCLVGHFLKFG